MVTTGVVTQIWLYQFCLLPLLGILGNLIEPVSTPLVTCYYIYFLYTFMIFFNFPICVTYGKIRQPEDEHKIIFFNISYNYQIKITITYYLYHPIERRASMNKDSVIKARCSSEIKQQVQNSIYYPQPDSAGFQNHDD